MKILFLVRQLNYGGAERQLVTVANELARRGHEVVIAAYYGGGALVQAIDTARVRLIALGKRSRWDLLSFYWKLLRVVRRERPAVLHGWMLTPDLVATMVRALGPRVKLFWCVRSSNLEMIFDRVESIASWFECRLSRFADCIVVNSFAGLEYAVSRGFPREKMLYIPNGIDTSVFYPDAAERKRVRAEWGVNGSEKVIGLVGRLDPIKNHPLFLKAAARLAAKRPDVRFVCLGGGPASYGEELQALTRTLGLEQKLLWLPERHDMRAAYNALDIFCSSSFSEGFPNVIGEAMACGRRCVVTDVGDSRLVLGDTGVVVPPDDVEAFAVGLQQELDAGNSLNLRARQRILENFTVAHLGDRYEQALLQQSADRPAVCGDTALELNRAGEARASKDSSLTR
ncbi:MAG: glycosyltransferase [Acidobacteria bacterium]|nr:glycosyltransferase [Acidobacteriota bacterium]